MAKSQQSGGEGGRQFAEVGRRDKSKEIISRYIETRVLALNERQDVSAEKEIKLSFKDSTTAEKAIRLFEDVVAYSQENHQSEEGKMLVADPYTVSEIKVLWADAEARQQFLDTYSQARLDAKDFKLTDIAKTWHQVEQSMASLNAKRIDLQQKLTLKKVTQPTAIKAVESQLKNTEKALARLAKTKEGISTLSDYEPTKENADAAAQIMYETLCSYHEQAKNDGFVWLPSRIEIHNEIINVMEHSGKSPLLIGPPGTGKTSQIDAVALELTGQRPIKIPCSNNLGEEGLIQNRDVKAGEGAYDYKGCIAEAYTGFLHSQDSEPTFTTGRVVNLDEVSQLTSDKALGAVKDVRTAKEGKLLSRYVPHKVLPGSAIMATSNLPLSDERLQREFGRIPTDYFKMSASNPELHEFMLAELLKDYGHLPAVNSADLMPAYIKKDFTDEQKYKLKDGSTVVGINELVQNQTDKRHGFVYRLSFAIRALQDAYIHGSKFNEKHLANTALYFDFDAKNNIDIKSYDPDLKSSAAATLTGGEMLKLTSGSSTLTAEIIGKWVQGFTASGETDLVSWLQKMMEDHIGQTSHDDAAKITALCNYFHIFDKPLQPAEPSNNKPLTPQEIGYCSPRVPRPLYTEAPVVVEAAPEITAEVAKKTELLTTLEVVLESGDNIRIRQGDQSLRTIITPDLPVTGKTKFNINGRDFTFAGTTEVGEKPVGSLLSEADLHEVFTPEEVEKGIIEFTCLQLEKDVAALCEMTAT